LAALHGWVGSIGWSLLFGILADRLCDTTTERKRVVAACFALLLLAFAAKTYLRAYDWQTDFQ
jgi:MFS family permease